MILKRDINRIISVLMLLSLVYTAAGYMFETDLNGVKAIAAVPGATSTNTVTTNPTPAPTQAASAAANATAAPTTNAAATSTPSPTANAAANSTAAPATNTTAAPTPSPTASAAANVTAAPTSNATPTPTPTPTPSPTANATTNATPTANVTATPTPKANATANVTASPTVNATSTPVPPGEPGIKSYSPSTPVSDIIGATRAFNVTVNQTVNVMWLINGTDTGVTTSSYINTSAAQGTWNVTVVVKNGNGSDTHKWEWVITVPGPPSILASNPPKVR